MQGTLKADWLYFMSVKIITEPSIEPVTLTEVKEHLRIDASSDFADSLTTEQTIEPDEYSAGTKTGTGIINLTIKSLSLPKAESTIFHFNFLVFLASKDKVFSFNPFSKASNCPSMLNTSGCVVPGVIVSFCLWNLNK